jgi:hypothetical protein
MELSVGFSYWSRWTQLDISRCFQLFFDSETYDNWTWFMTHLQRAIGDLPLLTVSNDACKGLENVVKDVFPLAE